MVSIRCIVLRVVAALIGTAAVAQVAGPVPGAKPGSAAPSLVAALEALGDPAQAVRGMRRLVVGGAAAVPVLLDDVQARRKLPDGDLRRLLAIFVLGKLRDRASSALPALLAELPDRSGLVQRQLLWAVGEIASCSSKHAGVALPALDALETEPGWNRQEWNIARAKLELGATPSIEDLDSALLSADFGNVVAAASALCDAREPPSPSTLELVTRQFERLQQNRGGGCERALFELARVLLAHDPTGPHRAAALALLARHFDPELRLRAIELLTAAGAEAAVQPLLGLLDDSVRELQLEAITALGILGPVAAAAVDRLEPLAAGDDVELARRATASLRAIRRAR